MLLGRNGGTRQFQQKVQMEDGEGKLRVSLGMGKCFQGLWFMLGKELQIVTSDWGCSGQCSHHLPSVRGSGGCLCPGPGWAAWLRVLHAGYGGGGKGKLGETLFLIFLPQVHWEEIHFQHGDRGGVPTVWIRPGSRIQDVCKKPGIRMVVWCQWDHPCPRRGGGCIGRCCLSPS